MGADQESIKVTQKSSANTVKNKKRYEIKIKANPEQMSLLAKNVLYDSDLFTHIIVDRHVTFSALAAAKCDAPVRGEDERHLIILRSE